MSRRRRKNPLLGRMIGISIAANLILLPVLAHFGAFKKLESKFHDATVVLVNAAKTEDTEKDKPKEKKAEPKKVSAKTNHAGPAAKPLSNAPKVVTGTGDGPGDAGTPPVTQGTQKAGTIPVGANNAAGGNTKPSEPAPTKTPEIITKSGPAPKPPVEPVKETPVPHKPVFVAAKIASGPEPEIPDDLRDEALEKTFVAQFEIGPDGVPTSVSAAQKTGIVELDRLALDAARKWRFVPATLDGSPISTKVRLRMEFKVE